MSNFLKDPTLIEELYSKESLVHSIVNKSPHFVAVFDPESSSFLLVNSSGCKMFECKEEFHLKKHNPNLLFADRPSAEMIYNWNLRLAETGSITHVTKFITLNEKEFWGLHNVSVFEYENKKYELHTIADITKMKETEVFAERERKKFATLFENSTIGILVTNSSGEIDIINSFAEKQFGYDEGELIGKKIEVLIPQNLAATHVLQRNNFIKNPHKRPMGLGLNLYGIRKDKTTIPVEVSLSHYATNEGTYVIAFISDISVRKKNEDAILMQQNVLQKYAAEVRILNQDLEQRVEQRTLALKETMIQLEKSKEELGDALKKEKELSDLKSRFVSMASHEFRTPLSTILSSASLIEKYQKEEENEKRAKHINRIKENVKNLNDILEDFLSLGKLEEGLITSKQDTIDIHSFLSNIINDMNEVKKEMQTISYDHLGIEEFVTDKYLLKNILINLISNAIKFSSDNGIVKVNSSATQYKLTISIKDNGIGISADDQEHLFDRFFRGKNAANIHGTGLGLHIVSKYLEIINGTISCNSELEKGTEFILTIITNNKAH